MFKPTPKRACYSSLAACLLLMAFTSPAFALKTAKSRKKPAVAGQTPAATPILKAASSGSKAATPSAPKVNYTKLVQTARADYAQGKYAAAADLYEKIPSSAPEFLRTREELAWSYLRAENWLKLRGELVDLNTKLVPLRWRLEGRVLSSMLYLKDCQYEKVREEVEAFQEEMKPLAHTIDQRLVASPNAAYWSALRAEVNEAIFKMKFVRMELRSRLVMLSRQQVIDTPERKDGKEKIASGAQVYPYNGDVWADEVFEKRGGGNSACAALHKAKVIQ